MKMKKGCVVCAAWTGVAFVMQIIREATRASASDLLIFYLIRLKNNDNDLARRQS